VNTIFIAPVLTAVQVFCSRLLLSSKHEENCKMVANQRRRSLVEQEADNSRRRKRNLFPAWLASLLPAQKEEHKCSLCVNIQFDGILVSSLAEKKNNIAKRVGLESFTVENFIKHKTSSEEIYPI